MSAALGPRVDALASGPLAELGLGRIRPRATSSVETRMSSELALEQVYAARGAYPPLPVLDWPGRDLGHRIYVQQGSSQSACNGDLANQSGQLARCVLIHFDEIGGATVMEGTVEQIMTKQVLTLAPDADVQDVAWGLTITGISGAPVQDSDGHVLGIVSKTDLADPGRMKPGQHETVAEAMTPLLFAIRSTASVMDAVRRMVQTGAHRLVVVNDEGKLAGIVTPMDVLKEMVRRDRYGSKTGQAT